MDNNNENRPDIGMIMFVLALLFLVTLLLILCAGNPGGGALPAMAVYTRGARVKLVRRGRRPGCCLALVVLAIGIVAWIATLTALYL